MSADVLRRAAALMRERAKAATPWPWRDSRIAGNRYAALVSDTMPQGRRPGSGFDEIEGYGGYLIGESIQGSDRAHIASWHPGIALAVADLLDAATGLGPANPAHEDCAAGDTASNALVVARAYLGEQP